MKNIHQDIEIRYTLASDGEYLKKWLLDPSVQSGFPMCNLKEVEDAVARWIGFHKFRCSLTAEYEGTPCGISTLYLQPYKKLAHQCEFGIILDEKSRQFGIGTMLINNLMHLAKERFKIELLHLQVYENNPAIRLYKRFGFREYGRQTHWIKEEKQFVGRIFMERFL